MSPVVDPKAPLVGSRSHCQSTNSQRNTPLIITMNFNKKGKCTVAKQSYTQSSKDELIAILNGKNKKEVSVTKNQLLYVWQSCKDPVQDKCGEEKKFTGMTKDELVKKIQEYNIECRPFVQSLEVETKSGRPQTKVGQPEIVVRDYSNVTFGPAKWFSIPRLFSCWNTETSW